MTKYEKYENLEVAYKKIGEELNKSYDEWSKEVQQEKIDFEKCSYWRGMADGYSKARELISKLQISILKEEAK